VFFVTVADVNGDGKPDLVFTNQESPGNVGVRLGNGDGTFQALQTFGLAGGSSPTWIGVADLNGDGRPDLVVADANYNGVWRLMGDVPPVVRSINRSNPAGLLTTGSANFTVTFSEPVTGVDPTDFAVASSVGVIGTDVSVSGCGAVYTVSVNSVSGTGTLGLNLVDDGSIKDALGNPLQPGTAAAFQTRQTFAVGKYAVSIAVSDLNGDGRPDLVVANINSNAVSVLLGNGDGTFEAQQAFPTGESPLFVAVSDVNGDGRPDLLIANVIANTVSVLLGNGDGTFKPQQTFATGLEPESLAIADLNGDGKPDLVVANYESNTVGILLGAGDGTFQTQRTIATGTGPRSVAVSDVNGDGRPDLVVANLKDNTVSVLLGIGNGAFRPQQTFAAGSGARSVAVSDVNRDGRPDLVAADDTFPGTVSVLLGNSNANFTGQAYTVSTPQDIINGSSNSDSITLLQDADTLHGVHQLCLAGIGSDRGHQELPSGRLQQRRLERDGVCFHRCNYLNSRGEQPEPQYGDRLRRLIRRPGRQHHAEYHRVEIHLGRRRQPRRAGEQRGPSDPAGVPQQGRFMGPGRFQLRRAGQQRRSSGAAVHAQHEPGQSDRRGDVRRRRDGSGQGAKRKRGKDGDGRASRNERRRGIKIVRGSGTCPARRSDETSLIGWRGNRSGKKGGDPRETEISPQINTDGHR